MERQLTYGTTRAADEVPSGVDPGDGLAIRARLAGEAAPGRALRPGGPLGAGRAGVALRSLRAGRAGIALRSLRPGVFAGPAGVDTIEAVCTMPDGDKPVLVLDALEGLLEFSLVRRDERTDQSRRFTMPQALRDFARGELEASDEADAVRRRHAEHVLNVADQARVWFTAVSDATARVLELEAEIRPALTWASSHDPELYRRLVCALALGLIRRGHVAEALGHATRACARLRCPATRSTRGSGTAGHTRSR